MKVKSAAVRRELKDIVKLQENGLIPTEYQEMNFKEFLKNFNILGKVRKKEIYNIIKKIKTQLRKKYKQEHREEYLKSKKFTLQKTIPKSKEYLIEYAQQMRDNPTPAEKLFRELLLTNGIQFENQKPIVFRQRTRTYILDFFIPSTNTVIEIDGGYHDEEKQKNKDKFRDIRLTNAGLKVVRFTNEDVLNRTTEIEEFIKTNLK